MKNSKQLFRFSPYVPWRLLGILFFLDLVFIAVVWTVPAPAPNYRHPDMSFLMFIGMSTLGPVLSCILCWYGSFQHLKPAPAHTGLRQTRRFSPLLWGLSGLMYAVGQMTWLIVLLTTHSLPPYPNISHFIQLLPYACFIGAILLLPAHSLSPIARLRILLDCLVIMAVVTTLYYYFLLASALSSGQNTLAAKVVGGLYPILDLLVIFSVLLVALRSGERVLRPVLVILGAATLLQFAVNVLHLYEMLGKNYNEFSKASAIMVLYGTLLIGAAQTVNAILRKGPAPEPPVTQQGDVFYIDALWKIVSPSVLALVFSLLVFFIWLRREQDQSSQIIVVSIGGFSVLVLMILRQFLAMYQINLLQKKLQRKYHSLDLLNTQLEQQATTDSLTRLLNHRAMAEKLDEALALARTEKIPCSVVFMDIDHFKAINDNYGHLLGDAALSHFARIVTTTVRQHDSVGRWGGEEFVAILPGACTQEAFQVAERIRRAIKQGGPICQGVPHLTCSLGIATYPQDAVQRENLLQCADRAMYLAKRLGRDQTRCAQESLETVPPAPTIDLEASTEEISRALLVLLETRSPALSQHARRVAGLALKLALELGMEQGEARAVALGGLLHDLGDVAMPDSFLAQKSAIRSGQSIDQARCPIIGAEILAHLPTLHPVAALVRAHSENVDGSGYPDGLRDEEIPLGARVIAVANAYEIALARRSTHPAQALKTVRRAADSRFDPRVIDALARVLALAPRVSYS